MSDAIFIRNSNPVTRTIVVQSSPVVTSKIVIAQQGPSGAGDKTYVHIQASAMTVWSITHNLSKYPSISIFDSLGRSIWANPLHINANQLTITFSAAVSGKAYLN